MRTPAAIRRAQRKILLSLFDGTGSITHPFVSAGWEVRRLDVDGQFGADLVCDILRWEPAAEWSGPPPDVIVAGPPCEQLSVARTKAKTPRNFDLADALLTKTLDIIDYFHRRNPRLQYFVENPDSSLMWSRWASHRLYADVANHPASVVHAHRGAPLALSTVKAHARLAGQGDRNCVRLDYCQYGAPYRKRTRVMTNTPWPARVLCSPADCPSVVEVEGRLRHAKTAQRGSCTLRGGGRLPDDTFSVHQLHAYPAELARELYVWCRELTGVDHPAPGPLRLAPAGDGEEGDEEKGSIRALCH